jgi:hypothetical protein
MHSLIDIGKKRYQIIQYAWYRIVIYYVVMTLKVKAKHIK